jgi:1-deoxy-D-xylulose-5-phosphate synthase
VTLLEHVLSPKDVRALPEHELPVLCAELREEIISICGQVEDTWAPRSARSS